MAQTGRYQELVRLADRVVVGLDFDGTLSPIVDDPTQAHIHPAAPGVLHRLAAVVSAVAVVTGRPVRQVLELGELEEVGANLRIFGQYGDEQWSAQDPRIVSPPPPPGLAGFVRELPSALIRAAAATAYVEEKGLAVAVHTRRVTDAQAAFERLLPVLTELAGVHGLDVEPGKQVIEVRSGRMHKGIVVERLVRDLDARGFIFAGDDLGDLEAFEALIRLREQGLAVLLVCSGSAEEPRLASLADVVVDGPDGVLGWLSQFTADTNN